MASLVSVIIPAYNHEAYVGEAIASVLAQELADFELIVIDDGSTDATAERIQAFDDPRIRFFRQENRGAAATLNRGLELARGRYLAILNSDDRYHSERLRRLITFLEQASGPGLVFSGVRVIDAASRKQAAPWVARGTEYFQRTGDLFTAVLRDNFICSTSNLVFHRDLLARTGNFLSLRYCHDLDFIFQALAVGPVFWEPDNLLDYRVHDSNTIGEIDDHGGQLFKFEVAAVLAWALVQRGLTVDEAPVFLDGLHRTQMGSLLDLVALLIAFFLAEGVDRGRFCKFFAADEDRFRERFLIYIYERDKNVAYSWKSYQEILARYEENCHTLESLHQTLVEHGEQFRALASRLEELNEIVTLRNLKLGEKECQIAELGSTLDEIYRSRGWRWLTRLRRWKSILERPFRSASTD